MAPSSICCPCCQKPFYGKQRRDSCTVCNKIFHAESCVPKLKPSQVFVCAACKCPASPALTNSLAPTSSALRQSSGGSNTVGDNSLSPSTLVDVLNEFFAGENSLYRRENSAIDRQSVVLELLIDQVKALQEERSADRALLFELLRDVGALRSEVVALSSNRRPHIVPSADFAIVGLTETWLSGEHFTSDYFPDGYRVFRCDRDYDRVGLSRGGGVLLAVRDNLNAVRRSDIGVQDECVFVEVRVDSRRVLLIGVVYFSPANSADRHLEFASKLERDLLGYDGDIVILGDFNLPKVDWCLSNTVACTARTAPQAAPILDLCATFGLRQLNFLGNVCNNVLDLCLTNSNEVILSPTAIPAVPPDSFHPPFTLNFYGLWASTTLPRPSTFNYPKGDYFGLYCSMRDCDWSPVYDATDVNSAVEFLTDKLTATMAAFIPRFPRRSNRVSRHPPWFSVALVDALRRKDYFHRKFKRTKDPAAFQSFRVLRATAAALLTADRRRLAAETRDAALTDPRRFWGLVNFKLKGKRDSLVLKEGDAMISDPTAIGEIFATQFSTVARDMSSPVVAPLSPVVDTNLSNLTITDLEVRTAITKLGTGTAFTTGVDGIPGFVVKGCGDLLLPLLVHIFNLSLRLGVFPTTWKNALVSPVFKKGFAGDPKNYRPISLLCILAKLFDSIMYRRLYNWFTPHLVESQHGFVSGRSIETNLASFLNEVVPQVEARGQVDVVYLDLAKAFDRVSHARLLHKLAHYGLGGSLLIWTADYLRDRLNTLKINGTVTTSTFTVQCGVPQGSSLGPLLFNIYANDLPQRVSGSSLYQFADDGKACRSIVSRADCSVLQADLWGIQSWCDENNIPINPDKTVVVSFSRKSGVVRYPYAINGLVISRQDVTRDLGVLMDSGLRFREQVQKTLGACRRSLGVSLKLAKTLRSKSSFVLLYTSLVRSRALFGSVVWGGASAYLLHSIEALQRKFVEHVHTHFDRHAYYGYEPLLQGLGLDPLWQVLRKTDLLFLLKVLRGSISCPSLLHAVDLHVPACRVRNIPTFKPRRSGLNPMHRLQTLANTYSRVLDVFTCTMADIKSLGT